MGKRWTPEEDELLRKNLPSHGPSWEGWKDILPGRTSGAIQTRKSTLGIKGVRSNSAPGKEPSSESWTDEQRLKLLAHVSDMIDQTGHTVKDCMTELSRLTNEYRRGDL